MNRQLKFRVWNQHDKCFMYSVPYDSNTISGGGYNENKGIYYWFHPNANIGGELCQIKQYGFSEKTVIQQFTGLTDKNGKEIYEGDIIKTFWTTPLNEIYNRVEEKFYSTVEYNSNEGLFQMVWLKNEGKSSRDFKRCRFTDGRRLEFEVIGNIFENPELLKKSYEQTK